MKDNMMPLDLAELNAIIATTASSVAVLRTKMESAERTREKDKQRMGRLQAKLGHLRAAKNQSERANKV